MHEKSSEKSRILCPRIPRAKSREQRRKRELESCDGWRLFVTTLRSIVVVLGFEEIAVGTTDTDDDDDDDDTASFSAFAAR